MRSYFLSSGQELCSQNPLSQAGEFSSGCIVSPQTLCAAAPAAAPVGHPSLAGDKAVPWLCARSGVCGFQWCFFLSVALFSGGDGLRWRGARGSPLLARKPDAWSHCLALPGKAGKASAGVIKQHAGAAGPEPPASEVPPRFVTRAPARQTSPQPHQKPSVLGAAPPWGTLRWAGL